MSFYTEFAGQYESVFPLEEETYAFLRELAPGSCRVLDVGCGTGDYCGRLADEGCEATGIDLDAEMVGAASSRFPKATFRVMDMRDLSALRGPFDCVYSIGNVLSHLPPTELPGFLADVHAFLEDGGSWAFQTVNWDHILRLERFRFPDVTIPEDRLVFEREYPRVSADGTVFATRLRLRGKTVFEGTVTLYPMRAGDYARAHEAAGFRLRGHYGDFIRGPFVPDTMSASVFEFERA
jgi:SAM-dependent methyltransferase